MGISASKQSLSFQDQITAKVEEEISRRMMKQRELNMALNIAKARDSLQIYGCYYATIVSSVGVAKLMGKPVSPLAVIPVVAGAVWLGNLADLAYGNKLSRVSKETEYILDNERARFVPFKQVRQTMAHYAFACCCKCTLLSSTYQSLYLFQGSLCKILFGGRKIYIL